MFAKCLNVGWVEVIVGSMFSGKSEELIRRINRSILARQRSYVFKHCLDKRYIEDEVVSHSGMTATAIAVRNAEDMKKYLADKKPEVVAIDEIQFFGKDVFDYVQELADQGIRVIVAGLDLDFMARPFGLVPQYMAVAEIVTKLNAICVKCGAPASRSQRIIDGRPAKSTDPIVLVGASDYYEARCRDHHEIED